MVTPVAQQNTLVIARPVRVQETWKEHSAGSLLAQQLNTDRDYDDDDGVGIECHHSQHSEPQ